MELVRPGCKRGHTAKHAPGFGIDQQPDGSYALATGAGFTPLQVLHEIRNRHDQDAAEARELQWVHDILLPGVAV